ncbi:MAG: S8 family serine peptidase [Trueperaceae bacterium]|nr:S8 family serine peptidase [Trueperaceae bacterium]
MSRATQQPEQQPEQQPSVGTRIGRAPTPGERRRMRLRVVAWCLAALTVLIVQACSTTPPEVPIMVEGCSIVPGAPIASGQQPTTTATEGGHVPGELLISYHVPPRGIPARAQLGLDVARSAGAEIRRQGHGAEHDLAVVPERDIARAMERLGRDPRVAHVSRNYVAVRLATPSDAHYLAQWYLRDFGAEEAWALEDADGSGDPVIVAIVDDGLNVDHVDIRAKVLPGRDVYCGDDDVRTSSDHGTHVAGIAAAGSSADGRVVGVAKGRRALVLAVKVFPDDTSMAGSLDAVIRGMRWAAQLPIDGTTPGPYRADVINLSVGFGSALSTSATGLLQETVDEIAALGIVMVAAAGNTGSSSGVTYPARLDRVIAVGSVDWDFTRSSFSTYGDGLDLMAPGGAAPLLATSDAVCRFGSIHTMAGAGASGPGAVECLTGTSMASPFVAGTAALLIAAEPELRGDPQAIFDRLAATARPAGSASEYGHGIVCPDAVLGTGTTCER